MISIIILVPLVGKEKEELLEDSFDSVDGFEDVFGDSEPIKKDSSDVS